MNVASLEFCKELHELSGWDDTEKSYNIENDVEDTSMAILMHPKHTPAYDLGYLLRKLPKWGKYTTGNGEIQHKTTNITITVTDSDGGGSWVATMDSRIEEHGWVDPQYADTPEDCAAKLAIQLFKEGILTRG